MIELLNRTVLTCVLSFSFVFFVPQKFPTKSSLLQTFVVSDPSYPLCLFFNFVDLMFSLELATKESATVVINFQCSAGEGVVGVCSS